jgi:hypothetical protein
VEGDRIPRRRRRRPIGETEPKTLNGRSANGSAAGPSAAPQPSESKSDETAS